MLNDAQVIEEILKHRKRLVINGKDFEKNPENNFTLQILGSVAELERAKIIERTTRGRQYRLSQSQLMGAGVHTFGYHYIRKSPNNLPRMVINEQEAAIVRRVFEMYADTPIGLNKLAQKLEEDGITTKRGGKLWRASFLKAMLENETYLGPAPAIGHYRIRLNGCFRPRVQLRRKVANRLLKNFRTFGANPIKTARGVARAAAVTTNPFNSAK